MRQTENISSTTEQPGKEKFKRGLIRYKTNPFIGEASANTKIGTKRVAVNKSGDKLMIMSQETGEIIAPAGFHHIVEVDKTEFVKLFKNGVKAFKGLTSAGSKVFSVLYDEIQKNPAQDYLYLSFVDINQETDPMAKATFYRGIAELLQGKFIAEGEALGRYFINPDYIFNGNRLAFIKEYRLKSSNPRPKDTKTKNLFNSEETGEE